MYRPWHEGFPERLRLELQALEVRGISSRVLDDIRSSLEPLVLELEYPIKGGRSLRLRAIYPDSFPYFRPEVSTTDVSLPRHQAPFLKVEGCLQQPAAVSIVDDPSLRAQRLAT